MIHEIKTVKPLIEPIDLTLRIETFSELEALVTALGAISEGYELFEDLKKLKNERSK